MLTTMCTWCIISCQIIINVQWSTALSDDDDDDGDDDGDDDDDDDDDGDGDDDDDGACNQIACYANHVYYN